MRVCISALRVCFALLFCIAMSVDPCFALGSFGAVCFLSAHLHMLMFFVSTLAHDKIDILLGMCSIFHDLRIIIVFEMFTCLILECLSCDMYVHQSEGRCIINVRVRILFLWRSMCLYNIRCSVILCLCHDTSTCCFCVFVAPLFCVCVITLQHGVSLSSTLCSCVCLRCSAILCLCHDISTCCFCVCVALLLCVGGITFQHVVSLVFVCKYVCALLTYCSRLIHVCKCPLILIYFMCFAVDMSGRKSPVCQ